MKLVTVVIKPFKLEDVREAGKIGDGKIFVAELQRVIRIRTGEADEAAL